MSLPNFLATLARRRWILILCILIPAIIVAANYWTAKPQYSAVTILQFDDTKNGSEEYEDVVQAARIMNTYASIASSKDVIAEVARLFSLTQAPDVDAQILTNQVLTNADSLMLSVTHPDPESAQVVTETLIQMLMAQSSNRPEFSEFPLVIERPTNIVDRSASALDWLRSLLLWSVVGALIGTLLVYLINRLDPKLNSTLEIERAAQLHTIAELPILKKNEPIVFLNGTSAQSEAYRSLRTILSNFGGADSIKTLLLTSAKSGEGKSTIAVNLAISMAQSGLKVLLVDCDMRKPAINEILNLPNAVGVSNILMKQAKISDTIRHLPSFRLDVMTSGPPVTVPAELLNSTRMVKLIEEVGQLYDMVIFDAPAILPVTDAVVLSRFVSSVVLVVGKDQVEGGEVVMAQRHLRAVGVSPIGVLINRVKPRESKYYQ